MSLRCLQLTDLVCRLAGREDGALYAAERRLPGMERPFIDHQANRCPPVTFSCPSHAFRQSTPQPTSGHGGRRFPAAPTLQLPYYTGPSTTSETTGVFPVPLHYTPYLRCLDGTRSYLSRFARSERFVTMTAADVASLITPQNDRGNSEANDSHNFHNRLRELAWASEPEDPQSLHMLHPTRIPPYGSNETICVQEIST
ncbi:hypothetical protein FQN50_002391 [Emmonsiellopsis sp. PD_5]|nr:hypothetical protein FQN50_002391 [Emmonsiellopsis sp. PD_5]